MQHRAMHLMSKKMAAALALESEFSEDGLAAMAGDDNMQMALAKSMAEKIDEADMQRSWSMIAHQAIRPDLDLAGGAPLRHQLQVGPVIFIAKERPLPAGSPLGDVVRQARCDDSCQSGHDRRRSSSPPDVNNCAWCPRNPGTYRNSRDSHRIRLNPDEQTAMATHHFSRRGTSRCWREVVKISVTGGNGASLMSSLRLVCKNYLCPA